MLPLTANISYVHKTMLEENLRDFMCHLLMEVTYLSQLKYVIKIHKIKNKNMLI